MFAFRQQLPRTLTFCASPRYSNSAKIDPRTKDLQKILLPWREKNNERELRAFRLVEPVTSTVGLLKFLQTPFDFRSSRIKSWKSKKIYQQDVRLQAFSKDRHEALGAQISAGHALLAIGAAFRYKGKPWMKYEPFGEKPNLPDMFEDGWLLEAIDVSGCRIRYECFENLQDLNHVHTFTAQNCNYIDDWCLDELSCGLLALENLDLTGCVRITPKGLHALVRLKNLKTLNLSDIPACQSIDGQLICLSLQDINPDLKVLGVTFPDPVDDTSHEVGAA